MIALLAHGGYEGFEETPEGFRAFIPSTEFDAAQPAEILAVFPSENWSFEHERNRPDQLE
jgi:hypothetical protein